MIDELHLLVHPVAARKGERLFDEGDRTYPLRLLSSEAFGSGVLRLSYAPAEPPAAAADQDVKDLVPDGQ